MAKSAHVTPRWEQQFGDEYERAAAAGELPPAPPPKQVQRQAMGQRGRSMSVGLAGVVTGAGGLEPAEMERLKLAARERAAEAAVVAKHAVGAVRVDIV